MKNIRHYFILTFAVAMTVMMYGQSSVDTMVAEWERAKAYTMEYLEAMPADKYNLKPTPEIRSFAEQMLHIADANYGLMASATGVESPIALGTSEKSEDKSKESTIKQVTASYDFVIENLKSMTPDDMAETITLFGKIETTKGVAIQKTFESLSNFFRT